MPEDKSQDFQMGFYLAKFEALEQGQNRIEESLNTHRHEERVTWDKFEGEMKEIRSSVEKINRWRAWIMGAAAGVSAIISWLWHWIARV